MIDRIILLLSFFTLFIGCTKEDIRNFANNKHEYNKVAEYSRLTSIENLDTLKIKLPDIDFEKLNIDNIVNNENDGYVYMLLKGGYLRKVALQYNYKNKSKKKSSKEAGIEVIALDTNWILIEYTKD